MAQKSLYFRMERVGGGDESEGEGVVGYVGVR